MASKEDYRKELEELEGGQPAPTTVIAPFPEKSKAEDFAVYLKEALGVAAEVKRVRGQDDIYYFDLSVPGQELFRVKLLYRLLEKGIRVGDLAKKSKPDRLRFLRDQLRGKAILDGGWRGLPCRTSDLTWYAEVAELSKGETDSAVRLAKEEFLVQREKEKKFALLGGGCLAGLGLLLLVTGFGPWGWLFLLSGLALLAFSLTR